MKVNEIYNENCLDTMSRMKDNFIDLVVTSPPYDNLRIYENEKLPFKKIAKELFRVLKKDGVIVWVASDAIIKRSESGTSFRQALYFKKIGFKLHDTMLYLKNGFSSPESNRYHQCFEYMFIFVKGKVKTFNPIKDKKNKTYGQGCYTGSTKRLKNGKTILIHGQNNFTKKYGMRYNYWLIKNQENTKQIDHPSKFPEQLANDHIVSWSNENELVYDPFMGSGTTAKMALINNRNFIGSEISKKYCRIANKRIDRTLDSFLED